MLHRSTGSNRPTRRSARPGREGERTYVDYGLTGTNRERHGLPEALAACRWQPPLVVTKLIAEPGHCLRPARSSTSSPPRQISLSLGGSAYDPTDAVWRLLFKRPGDGRGVRVRPDPAIYSGEGMKVAKAKDAARQATQAQLETGSPPGLPARSLRSTSTRPTSRVHTFGGHGHTRHAYARCSDRASHPPHVVGQTLVAFFRVEQGATRELTRVARLRDQASRAFAQSGHSTVRTSVYGDTGCC